MEDARHAGASRIDRGGILDIGLDDLNLGIAFVLLEIGAAAYHEAVEHPHMAALRHQPVDKMTADKSGPPSDQIKVYFARQDCIFLLSHRRSALLIAEERQNPSR